MSAKEMRDDKQPADPALPTGSAPSRDELAEQCRQAWHYAQGCYHPLERRWYAVADAMLRVFAPAAQPGETPKTTPKTWVDGEVELIAECLLLFDNADAAAVRRVCHYVLSRLDPPNYPHAF